MTTATPATSTTATLLSNLTPQVWGNLVVEADLHLSLLNHEGRLLRDIYKKVDSSEEAIAKAFDILDRQGMGCLDFDQFVEGLNRCLYAFGGTALPKNLSSLETLWAEASTGSQELTRRVSREAFGLVLRRLKMEILLSMIQDAFDPVTSRSTVAPGGYGAINGDIGANNTDKLRQLNMSKLDRADKDMMLKVFNFTKRSMYKWDVSEDRQRDFFLTNRTSDIILKWIMVECHDYTNIFRLAVKYCIHNLHLEDILKLETQKPKVAYQGGNHFVIIPTLRLSRDTDKALQTWRAEHHDDVGVRLDKRGRRMTPFPIMLEEATASVYSAGPPENDSTVITIRTSWRTVNNKTGTQMTMRKTATSSSSSSVSARAPLARQPSRSGERQASEKTKSRSNVIAVSPDVGVGGVECTRSANGDIRPHAEECTMTSDQIAPTCLQVPSVAGSAAEEIHRVLRTSGMSAGRIGEEEGQESLPDAIVADEDSLQREDWALFPGPTARDFDDMSVTIASDQEDNAFDMQMMHEVAESIYHTNSTALDNTAQWLFHSIFDHTVDRLAPIVEAYQIRVSYFQDMLHERGANFGKDKTKAVMDTKLDLLWLQRRVALLKPILRQLMRTVPPELQLYYQDVDDHLERCLEGLSGLCNTAQSIVDEAHHHREERINEILLFITIITSIFTPASFLASVFGMNFQKPEGGPGIPELKWQHGYIWFWLWSFLLSGGVLACVRYKVGDRIRWWG